MIEKHCISINKQFLFEVFVLFFPTCSYLLIRFCPSLARFVSFNVESMKKVRGRIGRLVQFLVL